MAFLLPPDRKLGTSTHFLHQRPLSSPDFHGKKFVFSPRQNPYFPPCLETEFSHRRWRGGCLITSSKQIVERRKHKRIRVKSGAFVGVGPHFSQVGPLVDISTGGLAFSYMARKKQPNGLSLDLFLTDGDFYLYSVPFKAVSDSEIPNNTAGYTPTRQCRVQFGDLTESQVSHLEHLIENHTTGEVQV